MIPADARVLPRHQRLEAEGVPAQIRRAVAEHKPLIILLGVGLVVRLLLLWSVADLPVRIVDERHYEQLARNIRDGHGFAMVSGRPTSIRPPLYPGFVAGVWAVTGTESLQTVRAAQLVLALLNTLVVYAIAVRSFDRKVALLAAAVFCLYPSLLFNGILLLTETLFTFLLSTVVLGAIVLLSRPHPAIALATGVATGLAALTRSVLWPFPLVLIPFLLFAVRGTLRARLTLAALVLVGYGAVVTPWAIRNTRLQGVFTLVDTMGGMNLRMGNYAHTPHDRMWDAVSLTGEKSWSFDLEREHPEAVGWTEGEKERWARRKALAYVREHPGLTLRRSTIRFADFWGLERELVAGVQQGLYQLPPLAVAAAVGLVTGSYIVLIVLTVLGVFLARPADWRAHALLLLIVLFVCGVHTLVFGHSRYHLPLVPILALYAAAALTNRSWAHMRQGTLTMVGAILSIGVFAGIWAHELLNRDAERVSDLLRLLW